MAGYDYSAAIIADWSLHDNVAPVTLRSQSTPAVVFENVLAHSRTLNMREAMLGGTLGLEGTEQGYDFMSANFGEWRPSRGDVITDPDGTCWTILSIAQDTFGSTPVFYSAICRKQR